MRVNISLLLLFYTQILVDNSEVDRNYQFLIFAFKVILDKLMKNFKKYSWFLN